MFLAYKAFVEKQFGHKLQRLGTDNVGEYVNNKFTSYCISQGIAHWKDLKNITPEEAWNKIKPEVTHLRVFGSIAWAHIPSEKRKAL